VDDVLGGACGCKHYTHILFVLVHGCRWTQAASGADGRANVALQPVVVIGRFPLSISRISGYLPPSIRTRATPNHPSSLLEQPKSLAPPCWLSLSTFWCVMRCFVRHGSLVVRPRITAKARCHVLGQLLPRQNGDRRMNAYDRSLH